MNPNSYQQKSSIWRCVKCGRNINVARGKRPKVVFVATALSRNSRKSLEKRHLINGKATRKPSMTDKELFDMSQNLFNNLSKEAASAITQYVKDDPWRLIDSISKERFDLPDRVKTLCDLAVAAGEIMARLEQLVNRLE